MRKLIEHDESHVVEFLDGDVLNVRRSNLKIVKKSELTEEELSSVDRGDYSDGYAI